MPDVCKASKGRLLMPALSRFCPRTGTSTTYCALRLCIPVCILYPSGKKTFISMCNIFCCMLTRQIAWFLKVLMSLVICITLLQLFQSLMRTKKAVHKQNLIISHHNLIRIIGLTQLPRICMGLSLSDWWLLSFRIILKEKSWGCSYDRAWISPIRG